VGILWDVLSFFPRRFHPFAVRPYAERAVPNLLGRLEHHIQNDRYVILSTHSQGTVLAYAALQQLRAKDVEKKRTSKVSFMTYGSPLSQLHARYFPALFGGTDYDDLSRVLYGDDQNGPRAVSWCNFYRLTDPIGKDVNFDQDEHLDAPPNDSRNVIVKDPCEDTLSSLPIADRWDGYPDPMRVPFDRLAGHSYYNHERVLKKHLKDLRTRMAATAAGSPPPSDGLDMSDVPLQDIRRQVGPREPVDQRAAETPKPPA
ncbi:MAG: hypothetical protein M3346_04880, partial [Actinomycetota bacterium]|nr:hypothetical protein [Actinomycetota bacterium]